MADYVLRHADRLGDKMALQIMGANGGGESFDYRALKQAIRGTATGLLQHMHPGDRIILQLGNSPSFPLLFWGPSPPGCAGPTLQRAL